MSLKLKFEKKKDHLVANFTGTGNLDEISQQFGSIAERCRTEKRSKTLINLSGIKLNPTFSERYQAGERAVVFAEYRIKLAVVAEPEMMDPGRLGEMVARNRGVDVRVFSDLASAEKWLLEKSPG